MVLVIALIVTLTSAAFGEEGILHADIRHRPPEMIIDENGQPFSGPLYDILEESAGEIGYKIRWRKAHFARSLKDLQHGGVDIVPRTIMTEERKAYIEYLGPIGYQQKDICFLVRKGSEDLLNVYDDLRNVRVGVKRKTAYFSKFDRDTTIQKTESNDDDNMAKMFAMQRFDTMIVLDKLSLEEALKANGITDYSYANYVYTQKIGNYFGMSKLSPQIDIYGQLNITFSNMLTAGRIRDIYKKYNLQPPLAE